MRTAPTALGRRNWASILFATALLVVVTAELATTQPSAVAPASARPGAVGVDAGAETLFDQRPVDQVGCGPTCILNTLRLGPEKSRESLETWAGRDTDEELIHRVIDTYAGRPSVDYDEGTRFRDGGVSGPDLLATTNDLRKDLRLTSATGAYLDRAEDETAPDLLARIHQHWAASLAHGEPVILHVRSFAAQFNPEAGEFRWQGVLGHFVVITQVPDELDPSDKGFAAQIADPDGGKASQIYVYAPQVRNFVAARGNSERWEWKRDFPFLLVEAPTLYLNQQARPWYERTLITAHYAIWVAPR